MALLTGMELFLKIVSNIHLISVTSKYIDSFKPLASCMVKAGRSHLNTERKQNDISKKYWQVIPIQLPKFRLFHSSPLV